MYDKISLQVNGRRVDIVRNSTISEFIEMREELRGKRFALSINGEVIRRSEYGDRVIHENDAIELVEAIGGG